MEKLAKNKYVLYGGVGIAAIAVYMLFFRGASADTTATDSTPSAYPDVTYAATPVNAGGGTIGTVGGDAGSSALQALQSAITALTAGQFSANKDVTLAQIASSQKDYLVKQSVTVFNSLMHSINSIKGLSYIRAVVPNIGSVVISEKPPAPKPKPKPAPKPKAGAK